MAPMENPKKTLTPNEINKFCYCPYQWYYERLYGTKELRRLAQERNRQLGLTDTRQSLFQKGLQEHNRVHFVYRLRQWLFLFCMIFVLAVFLWFYINS